MSFALSAPPTPWQITSFGFAAQKASAAGALGKTFGTSVVANMERDAAHDEVRLGLQPEASSALVMVVRAAALRNGLSRRVRSRISVVPNVPWMKLGPALLPLVS